MTLRQKLLLLLLLPAVLLGILGMISLVSLGLLEAAAGRILADNYRTVNEARQMERAMFRLASRPRAGKAAAGNADDDTKLMARFEAALGRCEANITEPGERSMLRRMRVRWQQLQRQLRGEPPGPAGRGPERGVLFTLLDDDIQQLVSLNERSMERHERGARRVARRTRLAVAISSGAALLALVFFALIAARRIAHPITAVADRLHHALNPRGDDTDRPTRRAGDEITRLGDELAALLERLARYEDEQARKLDHLHWRLVFVMDRVFEGLVLIDADQRILALNRVAKALLGEEAAEGGSLQELRPAEDVSQALRPLQEGGVRQEQDLGEVHHEMDGDERVYRPRVVSVPGADGAIEGHLVVFWDVTEQRRFEESRRQLISMLSHQLKTPMTSLSMSLSLLQEKLGAGSVVAPAQLELLGIASEDCNHLAALVSELIEAARTVAPGLSLAPRSVDAVQLLRSALRPLIPQAEEKGVSLELPPGERTIRARVDPVKFPWVVTNIVGNALRYTPSGGRIRVAVADVDGKLEVRVRDTGSGIQQQNLQRIFLPFVSLDRDASPGTHGLGLAIAKEIVEAHGGWIEAESEPGEGTVFRLQVPQ